MSSIRELPEALQKKAIAELNEVPARVAADIASLREWIESQPYLKARTDDQFLVGFLRASMFSLELAKAKIENYYTLRSREPEAYSILGVEQPRLLNLLRTGWFLPLKTPLDDGVGPRIWWSRNALLPTTGLNINEVTGLLSYIVEMAMVKDDNATISGNIIVSDLSGLTAAHLMHLTPNLLKRISIVVDQVLPAKGLEMHYINLPPGIDSAFRLIRAVLPKRHYEMLHLHPDGMDSFYKRVPQKYLPQECGGENGTFPDLVADMESRFLAYIAENPNDADYGVDLNMRLSILGSNDKANVFGSEGSFRKINVD